jgi:hypothetical protein
VWTYLLVCLSTRLLINEFRLMLSLTYTNGWGVGVLNVIILTYKPGNTDNPTLSDESYFGNYGGTFTSGEMTSCTQEPTVYKYVRQNYARSTNP